MRNLALLSLMMMACSCTGVVQETVADVQDHIPLIPYSQRTLMAGVHETLEHAMSIGLDEMARPEYYAGSAPGHIHLPAHGDLWEVLRQMNRGEAVTLLEDRLNRLAQRLIEVDARDYLRQRAKNCQVDDARALVSGADDAIVSWFFQREGRLMEDELKKLAAIRVAADDLNTQYEQLLRVYRNIPFAKATPMVDLAEYVSEVQLRALRARMSVVEKDLREEPSARSTPMLKRTFSGIVH